MQTVARALRIVKLLSQEPLSLSEVAQILDTHKSNASRLMSTLCQMGFARVGPDRKYRLGSMVLTLAHTYLDNLDLLAFCRSELLRLSDLTKATVHLGVLDETQVVYVDKVESPTRIQMCSRLGRRSASYCTGLGKALLAFLPVGDLNRILSRMELHARTRQTITNLDTLRAELAVVRKRGFAIDNEENEEGIACVAVPVLDFSGYPVAAISLTISVMYRDKDELYHFVPAVKESSRALSVQLGTPESQHTRVSP